MDANKKTILIIIEQYLEANPSIRFGQALFNLGINEFANKVNPENNGHLLRDIYNDSDDIILKRIVITQEK